MLSRVRLCTAGIILSGLGGCISPPTFVNEDKNHKGPPVEGIFAEIRCELLQAIKTNTELVTDGTPGRDIVADPDRPMVPRKNPEKGKIPGWTANMQLTLQLDENAGLTPSVSSIMPYTLAAFNLTFNAFGNFSTSAQRIYGQALTVKLRNLVTKSRKSDDEATVNEDHGLATLMDNGKPSYADLTSDDVKTKEAARKNLQQKANDLKPLVEQNAQERRGRSCKEDVGLKYGIYGDLGIEDIVEAGLRTAKAFKGDFSEVTSTANGNTYGAFGESIQFVLTRSLSSVGPTWTLTHFKGPGASTSNPGLFAAGRVETNKLLISFAPPGGANAISATSAASRASDLNTNLRLQGINGLAPSPF